MKDIAGRHVVSDNLGSAKYWKDANGVPMPDRSLSWLKFLSIIGGPLGLDHMYLRSPVTGFIKLITLGGFGIWYIWDILQVWLESDRVLTYGLTAPFDISPIGVGQGMITDKTSGYKSMASFPLFMLFTIFGFLGLDNLLAGQPGIAIRRVVDTIFFGLWTGKASASSSTVGRIILTFFALIAGFFVIVPWLGNVVGLFTGYANGISYFNTGSILNWFMNVYDQPFKDDPSEAHSKVSRVLRDVFGFEDRQREDIVKPFQVKDQSVTGESPEQELGPWIPAVGLANPLGAMIFAILNIIPLVGEGAQTVVRSMILEVPKEVALAQVGAKKAKDIASAASVGVQELVSPALSAAQQARDAATAAIAPGLTALQSVQNVQAAMQQTGGGRHEPLSYEAKILGATIGALVVGGSIKGLVDHLMG